MGGDGTLVVILHFVGNVLIGGGAIHQRPHAMTELAPE
jgi:hypothetical protein